MPRAPPNSSSNTLFSAPSSSFITERKYNLTSTTPGPRSRGVPAFDKESISEIIKTWQSLVQKFKTCLINEKKAGTGSRAVQHDFVYYEHMSFLKAALAHRKQLSTGIMQPANVQAPCTSA
ncbi:hypothetical protein TSAR_007339 [Trichomalopsis sarcophagae]|uniref:Uncharacterized protein n=1 Tax=Trichomalopsis sarcophagae TaxID=543379 RepID=A0A232EMX9_9HYME|nr:hypothetical protein TSAR_007339 [Trichomalopsis sarcophagae]